MNARTRKVLVEALQLPSEERSELARELLDSLHGESAPEIVGAWQDIIARRTREVLDGTAATHDLDEALEALEARARNASR